MSQAAGRCVFCNGTGLTKGHIWPNWLGAILPKTADAHEQEIGKFHTFESTISGPAYERRVRSGHARTRKPRNKCVRCNGGWMSSIESLGKNPALPLILGRPSLLDTFSQRLLAALLCLSAMRMEFIGSQRAVSPEDRNWLRFYREPTFDWRIWIGWYGEDKIADHWGRFYGAQLCSIPTDNVGPEYCNVHVSTMIIGKLCAHLFWSPVIDFPGYEGISLARIWPPSNFDIDTAWVPVLSDKETLWLHEAFARESKPYPGNV